MVFISTIVGVVGGFVIDLYSGIDVVGRILSVVCYEAHWFSFVVSLLVVVCGGCFCWFSRSSMSCKSQCKWLYSSGISYSRLCSTSNWWGRGEVGVSAQKVVSEVGWLVNVLGCVEGSLVVVECGVLGIVAGE